MKYYALAISFLLLTAGCRDIVVSVPEPVADDVAPAGSWYGAFGAYDESGEVTTNTEAMRRKDTLRISMGPTGSSYSAHGIWTISVYSYILADWSESSYAFSANVLKVGDNAYSMRLYINQGSAIYDMSVLDSGYLKVTRPDRGHVFYLPPVATP